jgi:cytidylate kinase
MTKPRNIAIDGPAGAGKSTIARLLAERLGILYLDTGAMYRAIGLKALKTGTDMRSEQAMAGLLAQTNLDIHLTPHGQQVILDGADVSADLRTPDVSRAASDVSALPVVRLHLVAMQRQFAAAYDLVLDGRDIGTYVLPQASDKFFLTADIDERARRRLLDLKRRGDQAATLEAVLADVRYRDKQDSERALAPLCQADDALLIDTTGLSIEEVVNLVAARLKQHP